MSEKDEDKNKVNGPSADYQKQEIRFFNSFEEMNKADAKEMAAFSPVQHLQHITEYLKHVFAKELQDKAKDMNIHFKKTDWFIEQ